MLRPCVIAALASLAGPALAASTAVDELFQGAPVPPVDPCGATGGAKDAFRRALLDFDRRLRTELGRARREGRKAAKADEARVKQELAAKGLAPPAGVDRARMRSMSKEERMAMAQQLMAQQAAAGGPAAPPGTAAGAVQRSREQQELAARVEARERQGRAKLDAFAATQAPVAREADGKELEPLRAEIARLSGGTIAPSEEELRGWTPAARKAWHEREAGEARAKLQYRAAADRYCARFGPAYRDALAEYRAAIVSGRAEYDELERLTGAAAAAPAGVKLSPVEPRLAALEALERYAAALSDPDVFRFDVRRPDDEERTEPAGRRAEAR